jgi:MoxR-like ATPase
VLRADFTHAVTGADLIAFQDLVRRIPAPDALLRYAVALVRASRPSPNGATPEFVTKWIAYGASVRAAQYLVLGAKARALSRGRYTPSFDDVRALAHPVLKHRILTNFHAESEGRTSTELVERLLEHVPAPRSGM